MLNRQQMKEDHALLPVNHLIMQRQQVDRASNLQIGDRSLSGVLNFFQIYNMNIICNKIIIN